MKILCLNGPFKTEHGKFSKTSRSPAVTKSGTVYYPIWLCYVAGLLEESGHEVKVLDSCAERLNLFRTMEFVKEFQPELVVLDTSTPSILADAETAAAIKNAFPNTFNVLMGTHPSALPEESLGLSAGVDAIAIGEADFTIRELAEKLSGADLAKVSHDENLRKELLSPIHGLAFRAGEQKFVNPHRELISNLDQLPFVSKVYKKHLDIKKYFFAACDYPEVMIMTSRGCVAKCTFCVYPQTIHDGMYRMRSPKNIADEFEWITKNLPEVREIGLEDDVFTGSQKRAIEFCKELIERKIKIKWYCNVRVDTKFETMQWMKKAGCVLVTVGYESANKDILKNIEKRATPEMILEFSGNTRKAGLLVHGCFMAGNRGETRQTLQDNLDLSLRLMDDTMQFFPIMVYPGTKDYEWAKANNLMTVTSYSQYVTEDGNHNGVIRMPDMTADEMRQWCNYARRRYYLRPKYIFYKMMQQLRHPQEIRRTVKATTRFVRFLVPQK